MQFLQKSALKKCIFCQEHPLLSARFLQKFPSLSDFFFKNICLYAKKAVPLSPDLKYYTYGND